MGATAFCRFCHLASAANIYKQTHIHNGNLLNNITSAHYTNTQLVFGQSIELAVALLFKI